jgi:hypothetical protein
MISKRNFRLLVLFYLVFHILSFGALRTAGFEVDFSGIISLSEYQSLVEESSSTVFLFFLAQFIPLAYLIFFIFRIVSVAFLIWPRKCSPLLFVISFFLSDIIFPYFVWWTESLGKECDALCQSIGMGEIIFVQPFVTILPALTGAIIAIIYSRIGRHLFKRDEESQDKTKKTEQS